MPEANPSEKAAEAMARNDAIFREANERIDAFAESVDAEQGVPLPFLCECADQNCTQIVRITSAEYESLRQDPLRFATVPGHEGDGPWAQVVEENDRYAIVEKRGPAARVADDLDPRSGGGDGRA